MREIKFRGKRLDNGEWVYGYFLVSQKEDKKLYIVADVLHSELFVIDPKTIGQCTGLIDKNCVEVFEGDICKYVNPYNKESYIRDVRYCPMFACFGLYKKDGSIYEYESDWLKIVEVEVIGNIHEHEIFIK